MIRAGDLLRHLLGAYGPQQWWPASEPFEIMVGALLVQRTTWRSAEAAITRLRAAGLLTATALATAPVNQIEHCIRPAGFYRSKAGRLGKIARWYASPERVSLMSSLPTADLRRELLALEGVGPETADVILLYAFNRPVVVIDEYLRRLVRRLSHGAGTTDDAALRQWIACDIDDPAWLNELHALVVEHGKRSCGARPVCANCPLAAVCETGRTASDAELGQGVGHFAENA